MGNKIIATIGAARSGKSTWWKNWLVNANTARGYNKVIICKDDIRLALHGYRYISLMEPYIHALANTFVRSLLIRDGYAIGLDETHTTIRAIKEVLMLDPDAEFIYLDTPVEVCKQRAIDTAQADLLPVIDRMNKNLIELTKYGFNQDDLDRVRKGGPSSFRMFDKPDSIYINIAIEYLRQEVKNGANSN